MYISVSVYRIEQYAGIIVGFFDINIIYSKQRM